MIPQWTLFNFGAVDPGAGVAFVRNPPSNSYFGSNAGGSGNPPTDDEGGNKDPNQGPHFDEALHQLHHEALDAMEDMFAALTGGLGLGLALGLGGQLPAGRETYEAAWGPDDQPSAPASALPASKSRRDALLSREYRYREHQHRQQQHVSQAAQQESPEEGAGVDLGQMPSQHQRHVYRDYQEASANSDPASHQAPRFGAQFGTSARTGNPFEQLEQFFGHHGRSFSSSTSYNSATGQQETQVQESMDVDGRRVTCTQRFWRQAQDGKLQRDGQCVDDQGQRLPAQLEQQLLAQQQPSLGL